MDGVWKEGSLPRNYQKSKALAIASLAFIAIAAVFAPSTRAQAQGRGPMAAPQSAKPAFRATHYEISAILTPVNQLLTAHAKVDFTATDTSRTVRAELHQNLKVTAVTDAAGKPLTYDRDPLNPIVVVVTLADAVAPGQSVTLNFDYLGPLSNEENSPVPGLRLASIRNDGAYLLLPSRWFPLTFYPSNRYTAVFKIQVPNNFLVAGSGKTGPPDLVFEKVEAPQQIRPGAPPPAPVAQKVFTFRDDREENSGTFAAGPYQMTPVEAGGLKFSVLTFASSTQTAQLYGQDAVKILTEFSDSIGPLADPGMTIAEFPDLSVAGFAGPGLALVSQHQWDPRGNTRLLSRLIASQWFGVGVMPASAADTWVTDGLSSYCEVLYAGEANGKEAEDVAIEEFAVGALMYENASPVTQADQLKPYTSEYLSVVQDKGALIFHMINGMIGDELFKPLLRDFYTRFNGRNARVLDFENLAQEYADYKAAGRLPAPPPQKLSPNAPPPAPPPATQTLTPFFAQWLTSTGVPEFDVPYTVYRTAKGFQVIGKVKQNIDTFSMPVEIEVETEGNPEFKTIQVVGAETPFEIDTFGRPKPGGVLIDPHDYMLKASPVLRIRAVIARGESLAEVGKFVEAINEYQKALDIQKNNGLALFRMGEAFFFQKNYTASANSFRSALGGETDTSTKWITCWSHVYMGKIYDVTGQRERAVNEYRQAKNCRDTTSGVQTEADKYISQPYKEGQ
jgi:tetratricopeptide (TPR) repeat protein